MSKYVLWDIPSSTMLLDTDDVTEARRSVDAFVHDNGMSILDELLLGVEDPDTDAVQSFRGSDILSVLDASPHARDARKVS